MYQAGFDFDHAFVELTFPPYVAPTAGTAGLKIIIFPLSRLSQPTQWFERGIHALGRKDANENGSALGVLAVELHCGSTPGFRWCK